MKRYLRVVENWLNTNLSRRQLLKFCLIAGMLLGMLAHGFMFANKIPNHDDLAQYADLTGTGVENGRYVLQFFWKFFSNLSTPWLNGILGLVFLCGAAFLLCDAFDCRRAWRAGAVTVVAVVFPVNVSIYCYMYQAHVLMLGIAFAAAAPWMMRYGGRWGMLWAALCVMLATGIYQIDLMLAAGLLIVYVIWYASREDGRTGGAVWGTAVRSALAVLGGLALYLLGVWAVVQVGGVALNDYQGISSMGQISWTSLPDKLRAAYRTALEWYITDVPSYATRLMRLAQAGALVIGWVWLGAAVVRALLARRWAHAALLAVCGLLLPVAAAGIYLMGDEIGVHHITLYLLIVLMLQPVLCVDRAPAVAGRAETLRRACAAVLCAAYLTYGFSLAVIDNQAYLRMYMSFTRAEHFMERLAGRIESLPDYRPDLRLVTVGYMNAEEPLIYFEYDVADRFLPFVGILNEVDFAWPHVAVRMLTQVAGLPLTPVYDWQPTEAEQAVVDAMPCYPAEGGVVIVGDLCIVRFS